MPKRFFRRGWLVGGLLVGLLFGPFGAPGASAQAITVSAAASLQDAMRELGKAFAAAQPGTDTAFNFAASGVLLAQLTQGAPVDVVASADLETMDRAQAQGLIEPATRANFAANELVLISPAARPTALKALSGVILATTSSGSRLKVRSISASTGTARE